MQITQWGLILQSIKSYLNKDIVFLSFVYMLMHGGLLFISNAVFWDDWVVFGNTSEVIFDTFAQAGAMFNWSAYLHSAMLGLGLWTYKLSTFVLMFSVGLLLNSILARYEVLPRELRFTVVLLFLVLPFNLARVALIDFPYTLCYFLFFWAWYLMDRQRLVALLLFFLSFNTNSLLVFYALPIIDMVYRGGGFNSIGSFIRAVYKKSDFLFIPFVYFVIKLEFFAPYGRYKGYNENPSISKISPAFHAQISDITNFNVNLMLVVVLAVGMFILLKLRDSGKLVCPKPPLILLATLLVLGVVSLFLAGVPYWSIGKVPSFYEWNSRHQLLFPLGGALTLTALLFLFGQSVRMIVLSVIIAASLSFGIEKYYSFFIDWNKQRELINVMAGNLTMENSDLIVFVDRTKDLNAFHRNPRFYEWNGLMERAFGDQKRFGVELKDYKNYANGSLDIRFLSAYKAGEHKRNSMAKVAMIEICRIENFQDPWYIAPAFPKLQLFAHKFDAETESGDFESAC